MKTSPSLLVGRLLKAIHPPLPPRSPREARQLVGALESAFQKQLDEAYPSPQAVTAQDPSREPNSVPDPAHQATRATHKHLSSLLAHPLLQTIPEPVKKPESLTDAALAGAQSITSLNVQDSVFLVQKCCRLYLAGLRKKEMVPPDRRLGLQLVNWYTQMSPSSKYNLLFATETLRLVVPVLYADGLESEVWDWLRTLYERSSFGKAIAKISSPEGPIHTQVEDHLISLMIQETAKKGLLDDAAQQFIQACKYYESRGLGEPKHIQHIRLGRSWNRLAQSILIRRHKHQLPQELYNEIIEYANKIYRSRTWDPSCLQVYHPIKPSAKPLVAIVKADDLLERSTLWGKGSEPPSVLLSVISDASQLSQRQGHYQDVSSLDKFSHSAFPAASTFRHKQSAEQAKQDQKHTVTDSIEDFKFAWT